MNKELFYDLVNRYLDGSATDSEKLLVESYYEQLSAGDSNLSDDKLRLLKEQIYNELEASVQPPARVIHLRRKWWKAVAAAVVFFAAVGITWQVWFRSDKLTDKTTLSAKPYNNDIDPAKGGAMLLLGDGARISLDSTANGELVTGDKASIIKGEGSLLYKSSSEVSYNTLITDKGKNYHLTLADGTQVWLDAMSSIRFPTLFPGAERIVEITGQAYFEVAHNARQPFKVKTGDKTIEVLGTHFNVNAHQPTMKTTLLEGSVKVLSATNSKESIVIKPGEQAIAAPHLPLTISYSPVIDEVMAWKNGRFRFTGNSVEEIFAQLSRWYDIDVVYEDKIPDEFVANISRDVPISKVLTLFEMTKQIKFKIDGKKITVTK